MKPACKSVVLSFGLMCSACVIRPALTRAHTSCQGIIGIWSVTGGFKPVQALRSILEPVSLRTKFSHYPAEMLLLSARIAVGLEKCGKLLLRHMRKYLLIISYGYKILHHLSTGSGRTRKGFRVKQIINIFFELILKQMPVKFQKIKCCESNGIAPILSDSHCQDGIVGLLSSLENVNSGLALLAKSSLMFIHQRGGFLTQV